MNNRIKELEAKAKSYCDVHDGTLKTQSQACSCRELKFARMEEENEKLKDRIDTPEGNWMRDTHSCEPPKKGYLISPDVLAEMEANPQYHYGTGYTQCLVSHIRTRESLDRKLTDNHTALKLKISKAMEAVKGFDATPAEPLAKTVWGLLFDEKPILADYKPKIKNKKYWRGGLK